MARTNLALKRPALFTHEGAPAVRTSKLNELRRAVLATLLWEDSFYESGVDIATRIKTLASEVSPYELAALAEEARTVFKLRHVPLLLLAVLAQTNKLVPSLTSATIEKVVRRADELAELVALYWKDGKKPLPNQMKKGLARAFQKFDEHQLAKYNRDAAVKLRDVMFLVHPEPKDRVQKGVFKRLAANELKVPDTWEVQLSAGADKKATFERLIAEENLGYMALLRNLRGMATAGVDPAIIKEAILARRGAQWVLPFRFVSAAKAAPQFERELDVALLASIEEGEGFTGRTIVLVDVSGSMNSKVSGKSEVSRMVAAATVASMIKGETRVFSFSNGVVEVPPRLGMAGVDAILRSQGHGGTDLGGAVAFANKLDHDRLIVITDEQSQSRVPNPVAEKAYMINVAAYKNGVGYKNGWTHVDGFSEGVLRYILESEREQEQAVEKSGEKPAPKPKRKPSLSRVKKSKTAPKKKVSKKVLTKRKR